MSYRNLTTSCGCNSCGCGCQSSGCNTCGGCQSCASVVVHAPSYVPTIAPTACNEDPCAKEITWAEYLQIDFQPLWQGTLTNASNISGTLTSLDNGTMVFESLPISMGTRDAYQVFLEPAVGTTAMYRYANTIEGLVNQQYINANGVEKEFQYLQVLATKEAT